MSEENSPHLALAMQEVLVRETFIGGSRPPINVRLNLPRRGGDTAIQGNLLTSHRLTLLVDLTEYRRGILPASYRGLCSENRLNRAIARLTALSTLAVKNNDPISRCFAFALPAKLAQYLV